MDSQKLLALSTALVVIASVTIEALKVTNCAEGQEGAAMIKSMAVKDCDMERDEVCLFKRGTEANFKIDFITTKRFSQAEVRIYGVLGFIPVPLAVDPSQACGNYGFDCPVYSGERKTLDLSFPVKKHYLKISATARFKLVDEMERSVICLELPIKVVD